MLERSMRWFVLAFCLLFNLIVFAEDAPVAYIYRGIHTWRTKVSTYRRIPLTQKTLDSLSAKSKLKYFPDREAYNALECTGLVGEGDDRLQYSLVIGHRGEDVPGYMAMLRLSTWATFPPPQDDKYASRLSPTASTVMPNLDLFWLFADIDTTVFDTADQIERQTTVQGSRGTIASIEFSSFVKDDPDGIIVGGVSPHAKFGPDIPIVEQPPHDVSKSIHYGADAAQNPEHCYIVTNNN